jgi:hypothetical protein
LFLVTFTKKLSSKWILFYQDNCQEFLVLQVNPKLYQDNKFIKTRRGKRQLSTGSAAALMWGSRQIYSCKAKLKKKKNSKRSTAPEGKTSSFQWTQQSGGVGPTPSTWQAEGIFGLRWPGWACYFRRTPLTTGWWDPAGCHQPFVKVNSLGCDPLSTSEPWFWAIPNSTLSPHKYLPVFSGDFCQGFDYWGNWVVTK